MSIPISQFIPLPTPSSQPTGNHKFIFCTSVFVFVGRFTCTHFFLDSTCKWYHMMFVFLWLLSVWQSPGPSVLLQMTFSHSFLWLVYICTTLSVSIPGDGHLGCFHVLAIVNSAAVNFRVHVPFWIMFFSRYVPRNGIAGSWGFPGGSEVKASVCNAGDLGSISWRRK